MTNRTYRCHHCLDTGTIRITGPDETIGGRTVRGQVSAHTCTHCRTIVPTPPFASATPKRGGVPTPSADGTTTEAQWRMWRIDNVEAWRRIVSHIIGASMLGRASMKEAFEHERKTHKTTMNNDWTSLASRDVLACYPHVKIETRTAQADREVA